MGIGWLFSVSLLFHFSFSHSWCHPHDNLALLHFKASLTINITHNYYVDYCDEVYPSIATWENGKDCCSWSGVTCHPICGHVIALDLPCAGLQGEITANSTLFSLSQMQSLNLAFNNFSNSQIPSAIGELVSLTHLDLTFSKFEGEIPPQISHLSKLQSLDLSQLVPHPFLCYFVPYFWYYVIGKCDIAPTSCHCNIRIMMGRSREEL